MPERPDDRARGGGPPKEESGSAKEKSQPARDAPPTSRFGRLARLTALAPRAIPLAAEAVRRAVGPARSEDDERQARVRLLSQAKKTAETMLKTLGEMKGLPLKFGQMASYIDGLAPPGYEDRFQHALKKLQSKAPPLSPESAVRVITREFGSHPTDLYQEWEAEPFAAASIGQVHRATTRGGEAVAVKVQYPGIDVAIENDLKSISMLESMVAPLGRKYGSKEGLDEIRSVFLSELDYTREAEMSDLFRKLHAEDPKIVIPRVVHSLSTKRVLTMELIGGEDYATFTEQASSDEQRAAAATMARFMYRSLYKYGLLYADPHPGNYRFLGDGRVAFLDFGCIRHIPSPIVTGMKDTVIALQEKDEERFQRLCVEVLGYNPADKDEWSLYTSYTRMIVSPLVMDEEFTFTREFAREAVAYLVRNSKEIIWKAGDALPNLPKPIRMPPEMTFVNRLQWGFASVLAGMGATENWRRLVEPWLHSPISPLPR